MDNNLCFPRAKHEGEEQRNKEVTKHIEYEGPVPDNSALQEHRSDAQELILRRLVIRTDESAISHVARGDRHGIGNIPY